MTPPGFLKPVEVAAGLVFRDGKLLITQRKQGQHLAGLWEFPGGKRESGETFEACLKRELEEELAISVSVKEFLIEISHTYPSKAVLLRFYLCEWKAGEPLPIGCQDLRWINREELRHFPFPEADSQILELLISEPWFWSIEK